jgi:hypothetical protein
MRRRHRKYERQSFNARLQMEAEAQKNVAARLTAVELSFKNQTRQGH